MEWKFMFVVLQRRFMILFDRKKNKTLHNSGKMSKMHSFPTNCATSGAESTTSATLSNIGNREEYETWVHLVRFVVCEFVVCRYANPLYSIGMYYVKSAGLLCGKYRNRRRSDEIVLCCSDGLSCWFFAWKNCVKCCVLHTVLSRLYTRFICFSERSFLLFCITVKCQQSLYVKRRVRKSNNCMYLTRLRCVFFKFHTFFPYHNN